MRESAGHRPHDRGPEERERDEEVLPEEEVDKVHRSTHPREKPDLVSWRVRQSV